MHLPMQPYIGLPLTSGLRETDAGLGKLGRPTAEKREVCFGWGTKQMGRSPGPKGS